MLSSFKYCLDATIPIFILMVVGYFLHKVGMFTDQVTKGLNSFVFRAALPALLFYDLATKDFFAIWDGRYVLYCFLATFAEILIAVVIGKLLKKKEIRGEFIQVSYRSSAAILGVMLAENLYGNSGMIPLMILGSVPLYNIAAVVILEFYKPSNLTEKGEENSSERSVFIKRSLINICKNPIILGILAGLIWSLLRLPMPVILGRTAENLGRTATPLGIMALGASFSFKESAGLIKESAVATFLKLIGMGMIFLPLCVHFGFTGQKLAATIVMCGSPATVSCYIMAKEMGHKGVLSSNVVMMTTLLSSVSLTFWLFIFKTMGML